MYLCVTCRSCSKVDAMHKDIEDKKKAIEDEEKTVDRKEQMADEKTQQVLDMHGSLQGPFLEVNWATIR